MNISLVVPVRFSSALYEGEERLEKLLSTVPADIYEVVIVDYGSTPDAARKIKAITTRHPHARLVRVDAETEPFSAGNARNVGAQNAAHDTIMFNDIDCLCGVEMYRRIAVEASARDIANNRYDFFAIPVAFLTHEGVEEFKKVHELHAPLVADAVFQRHVVGGVKQFILQVAYSGSTIVVNRFQYLALGGTNQNFHGHGAEDYEIKLRLAAYNPIAQRPLDYYLNTKVNQTHEYVGFRAYLSLYGLESLYRGLYMVHLWHPRREVNGISTISNGTQYKQTERNFALLRSLMMQFDNTGSQPTPLPDLRSPLKTLVLCRPNSLALESLRQVLPFTGQFQIVDEQVFPDSLHLIRTIKRGNFNRVLFLNPYANEHRLSLYRAVRSAGIALWVYDRGALPHSWFFDPNGFNAESSSYSPERWDRDIGDTGKELVRSYIRHLKSSSETLEANGPPKSAAHQRDSLGVGHRKVLFVPLQRPNDTVTRFFNGKVGLYPNFYMWVTAIAAALDSSEWLVVAKKHPNETAQPQISGVTFVSADTHVHDLLELADAVLLLNSGVGLLSLAFGKPVIACGEAFYAHPGLALTAESVPAAISLINEICPPDHNKTERFLHYLLTEFYSFGYTEYVERKQTDGSTFTAAKHIRYESIRQICSAPRTLGQPMRQTGWDSILFSSFGGSETLAWARVSKHLSHNKGPEINHAAQQVEKLVSGDYNQLYWQGCASFHAGQYEAAVLHYTNALSLQPDKAHLRRVLAEALIRQGHLKEATSHMEKAHELLPNNKAIKRRRDYLKYPLFNMLSKGKKPFPVPTGS